MAVGDVLFVRARAGARPVNEPSIPLERAHGETPEGVLKVALGLLLEHLDERFTDLGLERPRNGRHLDCAERRQRVDDGSLVRAEALRDKAIDRDTVSYA